MLEEEELEEFPVGNVCTEKQGSQHFSCTTLHKLYELCIMHRLSPVLVHVGAGMHIQCVLREAVLQHHQVVWEWMVGSGVDGGHHTSAVLLSHSSALLPG